MELKYLRMIFHLNAVFCDFRRISFGRLQMEFFFIANNIGKFILLQAVDRL